MKRPLLHSFIALAYLLATAAVAQEWSFQSGGQTNNGSVTIKSIDGSGSRATAQNPTGAAARANHSNLHIAVEP